MATAGSHNAMERRAAGRHAAPPGSYLPPGPLSLPWSRAAHPRHHRTSGHIPGLSPWDAGGHSAALPTDETPKRHSRLCGGPPLSSSRLCGPRLSSRLCRRPRSPPPDSADDPRSPLTPSSSSWAPGACGPNHCLYEPPPLDSSTQGISDSFKKGKGEAFKDTYSLFSSEKKRGWKTVTLRTTWGAWST